MVSDKPKVLADVGGKPFLCHLLHQFSRYGVSKAVLCTGYQGEKVRAAFGESFGTLQLIYSQEQEPRGTAGALRLALPFADSDPILVLNGDSYCEVDLQDFFVWHTNRKTQASLVLTEVEDTSRFGRVECDGDGAVLRFGEKAAAGRGWINAGVYLLGRPLLESIPEGCPVSLEREIFPAWVGKGLLAYRKSVRFLDIGTPESYAGVEAFFGRRTSFHDPTSGRKPA
jgi:NDP-sugar pyrophosphorylase family protein